MDEDLVATYTLIHSFLVKQSHTKVAQALQKAVKDIGVLKDDIDAQGPQLNDIIRLWKASQNFPATSSRGSSDVKPAEVKSTHTRSKPRKKITSSSEESTSASSSDSESSSNPDPTSDSDSSSNSKPGRTIKTNGVKPKQSSTDSSDSDSGSESFSSESESSASRAATKNATKKSTTIAVTDINSSKSGLGYVAKAGHSSVSKTDAKSKARRRKGMKTEESTGDDSSSEAEPEVMGKQGLDKAEDNVDESPSSGENEHEKVGSKHKPTKTKRNTSSSSTSNKVKPKIDTNLKSGKAQPSDTKTTADKGAKTESPQPDAGAVRVTKRRRTSDSGAAVAVATTHTPNEDGLQGDAKVKHEANGRSNTSERFKRVDPVKFKAHVVGENRYDAKDAPNNDYGKRAHQDLIVTRGAGFRKEKNKKKRGSYRGGEITMESHSFKFAD